jgi:hypothetical protein
MLVLGVGAVWLWQSPGAVRGKLTPAEIDRYMATVSRISFPPELRAPILARMRTWAEADDGRPVYMLNLMRYHPELRRFEGTPSFAGTPQQANEFYEERTLPLALGVGAIPIFAGPVTGENVIGFEHAGVRWNRVLVMRYPSRRAFLDLLSDPAYAPLAPYKLMSLDVDLAPMGAELTVPDVRYVAVAAGLVLFLAAGWWRASRAPVAARSTPQDSPS